MNAKYIINQTTSWGETRYTISANGRVIVTHDRAEWESAVQQLRDQGAEIIDNYAINAQREAEKQAMMERMKALGMFNTSKKKR